MKVNWQSECFEFDINKFKKKDSNRLNLNAYMYNSKLRTQN